MSVVKSHRQQSIRDATKMVELAKLLREHGYSYTARVVVDIAQEIVEGPLESDTSPVGTTTTETT